MFVQLSNSPVFRRIGEVFLTFRLCTLRAYRRRARTWDGIENWHTYGLRSVRPSSCTAKPRSQKIVQELFYCFFVFFQHNCTLYCSFVSLSLSLSGFPEQIILSSIALNARCARVHFSVRTCSISEISASIKHT